MGGLTGLNGWKGLSSKKVGRRTFNPFSLMLVEDEGGDNLVSSGVQAL